jgi:serine/threonine-protein kinase
MGGTWGPDNTIYFAPYNTSGLLKIPASGGTPQQVTKLDRSKGEISHRWPHILPGGKALVFTIWIGPGWDEQAIAVRSLGSGQQRILMEGGDSAQYVQTGHLVYSHAERLMAVPFDAATLRITGGPPVQLNEKVVFDGEGADLAISLTGSLAYIPPSEERNARRLAWVDRNSRVENLAAPPRDYQGVRLSPDGHRILATIMGPRIEIWIYDMTRSALTRLTSEEGSSQWAIWTPDGKRAIYRGTRMGFRNLYLKSADGSGAEERISEGESLTPFSISPDRKYVVYGITGERSGPDLWMLDMEGKGKPRGLLTTMFNEKNAMVSPDGRFMAYNSNESGRNEVYVQPFPGPGGKLQVSTEGGNDPVWNRNGKELFYLNGDKMMSVSLSLEPALTAASPKLLFEVRHVSNSGDFQGYDVSPDGSRFLMIKGSAQEEPPNQIQIVLNWFDELKRLVPSGKK